MKLELMLGASAAAYIAVYGSPVLQILTGVAVCTLTVIWLLGRALGGGDDSR